jgi:hypothetical protein
MKQLGISDCSETQFNWCLHCKNKALELARMETKYSFTIKRNHSNNTGYTAI